MKVDLSKQKITKIKNNLATLITLLEKLPVGDNWGNRRDILIDKNELEIEWNLNTYRDSEDNKVIKGYKITVSKPAFLMSNTLFHFDITFDIKSSYIILEYKKKKGVDVKEVMDSIIKVLLGNNIENQQEILGILESLYFE
jgi:hypothetical protein